MYDTALFYQLKAEQQSQILDRLRLPDKSYILATVHRAENTDDLLRLQTIIDSLKELAQQLKVVFPLHPRTRNVLSHEKLLADLPAQLQVIDPVGYLDMIRLEKSASLIVTDSGGVQKEGFFYGVPCVTLRDETEWVELVDAGWNRLCPPTSVESVISTVKQMLKQPLPAETALFGNGKAAEQIIALLVDSVGAEHHGATAR